MIPYGDGNFGSPLHEVSGLVVPNDLFFVRNNGPVPIIDPDVWRLRVDGLAEHPLSLSLAELQALPRRSLTGFLECAGNGRTRFDPPTDGTPWKNDAVGNAEWEGVALGEVLDLAGVKPESVEIVSQGGDFAKMNRGLPLDVARDPDTLLVWAMNGERLTPAHGAPVRLFVPGWAGIAATKWLVSLTAVDRPWDGFYNVENYVLFDEAGNPVRPVRTMPVKSTIASPREASTIAAAPVAIVGFAWSGDAPIAAVDVSTDGGDSYAEAEITHEAGPRSWVRFRHRWSPEPGQYRLRSRARDAAGNVQPETAYWNLKGYQMNGILEIPVIVAKHGH